MMKLSKIFKIGVVALLATSMCFVACKKEEDDENAIDGNKISLTNTSEANYRGFQSLKTKHTSSTATITIKNPTEIKNGTANSVIGFVFGLEEVKAADLPSNYPAEAFQLQKDGTYKKKTITYYNFGVAGVRYNKNGQLQWYVSYCKNIPNTIFGYNTSGDFKSKIFVDAEGNLSADYYGDETEIIAAFEKLNYNLVNGTVQVRIQVKINEDGKYTVTLQDQQGEQIAGSTVAQVPVQGLTKTTQKEIGRYVTVYSGETVDATMTFSDTVGNPIPVTEDDWVDLAD